jgi:hypothetical protein
LEGKIENAVEDALKPRHHDLSGFDKATQAAMVHRFIESASDEEMVRAVYPLSDVSRSKLAAALDLARGYTHVQYIPYEVCTMPHGVGTRGSNKDDWYIGKEDIPEVWSTHRSILARRKKEAPIRHAASRLPSPLRRCD